MDRSLLTRLATQFGIYNGDKAARFEQIEAFANAVAKIEREACSKLCDELSETHSPTWHAEECAAAIRARGNK